MTPWALVTPSSRGIGLALSRRLLRTTKLSLVATARGSLDETREAILRASSEDELKAAHGPSSAHGSGEDPQLEALRKEGDESRLTVLKLDVTDEGSIADAAGKCKDMFKAKDGEPSHLHLAFVLPGLLHPERSPQQLELENIEETFRVNTFSHLLFLKYFAAFLPKKSAKGLDDEALFEGAPQGHATWATMSARVGSTSDNSLGGWYSYRASKAAVNSLTRTFDRHLVASAGEKAIALSMHPGTVKTGLSQEFWNNVKEEKLFEKEFVARRLIDVLTGFGGKEGAERGRGRCWDWKGEEIQP